MSSNPAEKRTTRKAHSSATHSPATKDHHGRIRRIALLLLYVSALGALVVWEYREQLEVLSSDCELRDTARSSFYNLPYESLLNWASSDAAEHVVTLAIPADLEEVQKNLCLGREYMADVLRALGPKSPGVVVVDKFYSAGTCASSPSSTTDLVEAVQALKSPVVIGESTDGLEQQTSGACLVRKPQLDFGSANVRHGLTRLDSELERLPMRWLVLPAVPEEESRASDAVSSAASGGNAPHTEFADSLSFAAVKAYDPAFASGRKLTELARRHDHAYANLSIDLPRMTTTQLLCSTGDEGLRKKWSLSCAPAERLPEVAGRIVVIGSEVSSDDKLVLGHHMWGFQLQARYMESLLSGDYLRFLPLGPSLAFFALFIFLIEGLPTILIARRPRWRRLPWLRYAYPRKRYVWVVSCTLVSIALSAVVALVFRYLPPLLVYGEILFVSVTRLLIFLAESAEEPFVHAHHPATHPPTKGPTHV